MYIKDELTGLYNRRALICWVKYLDQSIVEQTKHDIYSGHGQAKNISMTILVMPEEMSISRCQRLI